MKQPVNTVKGFANLATGANADISDQRMAICKRCHVSDGSNWCKKINGGCGCYLPSKTTVRTESCGKGKW